MPSSKTTKEYYNLEETYSGIYEQIVTGIERLKKTFESYILDGKLIKSSDFHKALRYLGKEEEEDDATPTSRAEEIDESGEARAIIDSMETVDTAQYSLRKLHEVSLSLMS